VAFGLATGPRVAASPGPAQDAPGETATWSIQPASEVGEATRPAFSYELAPGTEIADAVRVTNFGDQPLTLQVSAHDAFNTPVGDFDVLTSASESVDVGSWVALDAGEVALPARGSIDVPFRVAVPSNASPGDHAGGIVAAHFSVAAADSTSLLRENRVGTRVYVRVAGPLRPALVVSSFSTRFEPEGVLGSGGAVVATYTVRNTGNVRLAATQSLAVEGPFGLSRHTIEPTSLPELLPGGEFTGTTTIDDVRAFGRLSAALTLETEATAPDVIEARSSMWAVPWRLLCLVAVAAAAYLWRRRHTKVVEPVETTATTQQAERQPNIPEDDDTTPATGTTSVTSWLALALVLPLLATAPDGATQAVRIEPGVASVGDVVAVTLDGWPQGPAQVELCGNAARQGSVDCSQLGAIAVQVADDGTARAELPVVAPPTACPCVVRVSQVRSGATATVPIELDGVDPSESTVERPPASPARRLVVVASEVVADEGYAAWFGADVGRQATVVVRNDGSVTLDDVTVSARLVGGLGTSIVIDSPPPFDLAAGDQRTVTLTFELPAPAVGDYRIEGRVDGGDEPVPFSASTSHLPWGLVNSLILLVAAGGVVIARRRRQRPVTPVVSTGSTTSMVVEPVETTQTTDSPDDL